MKVKKIRKDKNGWYLFKKTPASKLFINDDLPNIICRRYYVAGVLYPWEVMSGKLSDDKKTFYFDGKIIKTGFAATKYYKNNSAIKKLMIKNEIMPVDGKLYALTGGPKDKCISNGNTWKESEVKS